MTIFIIVINTSCLAFVAGDGVRALLKEFWAGVYPATNAQSVFIPTLKTLNENIIQKLSQNINLTDQI